MNDYKELVARLRAIGEHLKFDKTSCVYLAADAIEQLVKERDESKKNCDSCAKKTTNCITWLQEELAKIQKERDAAVADLRLVANNCFEDYVFSACICCKKNDTCNGQPATGCEFEWRGAQEDNDETD